MKTAIIILNTNDSKTTLKYVRSIVAYTVFNHIIVVDNCSTDEYIEQLKGFCRDNHVDFVVSGENRGYNAGNNVGARFAMDKYGADVLFISNSDIICPEESVRKIIKCFSCEKVAVATGLIHVYDKNRKEKVFKTFAWQVPGYLDMCLNCFPISTKIRKDILHTSNHYSLNRIRNKKVIPVEVVSGCFFAIRADVYREMGGFEERIFLYCEENVLGYTMKKLGYKECVAVTAPVIHDEASDKMGTLKKIITHHKRTLKSTCVYMKEYLKKRTVSVSFFCCLYIAGAVESYIIQKIRRCI